MLCWRVALLNNIQNYKKHVKLEASEFSSTIVYSIYCRKRKQKVFQPRPKGDVGFFKWLAIGPIGVLRPLKNVSDNNMERLSLRESISKRWTTLKTKVFGGPSFECIDNYILLVIGLKSIVIEAVVSWPFQVCMMSLTRTIINLNIEKSL